MLHYHQVIIGGLVLAAFSQRYHAQKWGRRRVAEDEIRDVAQTDLRTLSYLVLDGRMLVAAFASRDDAKQWIEECGHPAMELREMSKGGKAV